jgi:hypothetical protein
MPPTRCAREQQPFNLTENTDQVASDHRLDVAGVIVDGDRVVHQWLVTGAGQGMGSVVVGEDWWIGPDMPLLDEGGISEASQRCSDKRGRV